MISLNNTPLPPSFLPPSLPPSPPPSPQPNQNAANPKSILKGGTKYEENRTVAIQKLRQNALAEQQAAATSAQQQQQPQAHGEDGSLKKKNKKSDPYYVVYSPDDDLSSDEDDGGRGEEDDSDEGKEVSKCPQTVLCSHRLFMGCCKLTVEYGHCLMYLLPCGSA